MYNTELEILRCNERTNEHKLGNEFLVRNIVETYGTVEDRKLYELDTGPCIPRQSQLQPHIRILNSGVVGKSMVLVTETF